MWADNETPEDLLGFKVHTDLLVNIINYETVLPITIGVFGDWASEKSGILQIVKEEFGKEDDTPLRHPSLERPINKILTELLTRKGGYQLFNP